MPEQSTEYAQHSRQIVEQLRDNQHTVMIETLAGPEELLVGLEKITEVAGIAKYFLFLKDHKGKEVATLDYSVDRSQNPPIATVENKTVEPAYRGKDLAKKMFALMAKDLEDQGILLVKGKIRKENASALVSRQHVRELLTGRQYHTEHAPAKDQAQFYEVTTYLDQFEDEQGES
ncbi:hypothetical protein H3C66_04370 [Patescibacteria group bacterium]|nr:hypothetical protein [Patescibacteria group bacterium]